MSRASGGATLTPLQASGVWDQEPQELHINVLELQAVFNALCRFQNNGQRPSSVITIPQLNCGCLHTPSGRHPDCPVVYAELTSVSVYVYQNKVELQAIHILSNENVIANTPFQGIRSFQWNGSYIGGDADHLCAGGHTPHRSVRVCREYQITSILC